MTAVPPRATYRLQLHAGFTFDAACAVIPYLADLGVSHVYCSPIFRARPGSQHGYDILDHRQVNPELGGEEGFVRLAERCREFGLGILLDFVPNHMGVGGSENPFWKDVLEWGEASLHARWFDIDWTPEEPTLQGRVLLPFLGRPYGEALAEGEIGLAFDAEAGELAFAYYDHRFPLAPHTYAPVLAAAADAAIAELAGAFAGLVTMSGQDDQARRRAAELKRALAEALRDRDRRAALQAALDAIAERGRRDRAAELHGLLERQHFRLAYWRVAADEINYRRFFDINSLAGLRMNNPEVFDYAHAKLLDLIGAGHVQGVRLDHVDGMADPAGYCRVLQHAAGARSGAPDEAQPLYLLVEKILAPHEALPQDWPVAGTTGYDFMTLAAGLFVDPAGERPLTRQYRRYTRREADFDAVLETAKRQIVRNNLGSELAMIARRIHRIAKGSWRTRDFTLAAVRAALIDILAAFPVYRTYVGHDGPSEQDRRYLDWAVARAKRAPGLTDESVYDFILAILCGALRPAPEDDFAADDVFAALRRFEQTTPPVMAKSMEDTAFYRYLRLVSLNEVGGEPSRFGVSGAAFDNAMRRRLAAQPGALNATATHDHKRGEDARARIDVLSEAPKDWAKAVSDWSRQNRRLRKDVDGAPAPDRNAEYLLYQTVAGAWPLDLAPDDTAALGAFADRVWAYMQKAAREAKERTSWAAPRAGYEDALEAFVRGSLEPWRSAAFLQSMHAFVQRIAPAGAVNGLAQTVLKLTAPGVPDIYQGTEFWDFSLVDPDNRRPVDYRARQGAAASADDPQALAACWRDGRIKLAVVRRLLGLRAAAPQLFAQGDYVPLEAEGPGADRILAFERALDGSRAVVIVPRLCSAWVRPDRLALDPAGLQQTVLKDCDFGGGRWLLGGSESRDLAPALAAFPVAVWTNV